MLFILNLTGERGSGKTYTFSGGKTSHEGIVPLAIEHAFKVVSEGTIQELKYSQKVKKLLMLGRIAKSFYTCC